ncbi:MAG: MMPL family transporter [Endozoicomonas sp.]|uniref:MMPL family transporter n=1 Tax=Endozoicomonas sp. TaxID=1892382 RepID=UPI003D9B86BE
MNNWPVKHAWWTIGLWILLLAVAIAGMGRLALVNDYKVFFSEENPDLTAFEQIEARYSNNDSVLVVVAPKQSSVFQPDVLNAVIGITERGWQTPHSYRVDSLSNYQYTRAEGDDLLVEDFVESADLKSNDSLVKKQEYALRQPELINRIIAKDGQATAINVLIRLPGDSQTEEVREVAGFWQAEIAKFKADYPELDFYLTGQIMQNDAFGEATQRDMGSLVPLALLLIIIGTGLYLRSIWSSLLVAIAIISSIMVALGMAGWLVGHSHYFTFCFGTLDHPDHGGGRLYPFPAGLSKRFAVWKRKV